MPTIPIKDLLYGALIVVLIAAGLWYHHALIGEGIAKQKAADDSASAILVADTAKQTAELQAKAVMAKQAYDKEHTDNQNYRDSHPSQPVRLCRDPHTGGTVLPQAGAFKSGNASSGAAAAAISNMPSGNSGGGERTVGPDIEPLLSAFGAAADSVSAALREFQSR